MFSPVFTAGYTRRLFVEVLRFFFLVFLETTGKLRLLYEAAPMSFIVEQVRNKKLSTFNDS